MIRRKKRKNMTLDDALVILKWDQYCDPAPTLAETKAAMEIVKEHPDRWNELFWGPRP